MRAVLGGASLLPVDPLWRGAIRSWIPSPVRKEIRTLFCCDFYIFSFYGYVIYSYTLFLAI